MSDNQCFVCNGHASFLCTFRRKITMRTCASCGAMWQVPLKTADAYKNIYSKKYYSDNWGYSSSTDSMVLKSKFVMSKKFIALLSYYKKGGRVLDIGAGLGYLLSFLRKEGYDVYGTEISSFARNVAERRIGKERVFSSLTHFKNKKMKFDSIILFDSMEHIPNQHQLFTNIHMLLADKGIVLVVMPMCHSLTAKIMGRYWLEYKKDHVLFYSENALRKQLATHGFVIDYISSSWKTVTVSYILSYLSFFRLPLIRSLHLDTIVPRFILDLPISLPLGHMAIIFKKQKII